TQYGNIWDIAATAGEPSGYTLTLRSNVVAQIQESAVTQTLETIDRRINALGLTEPIIQPRGGQNSNRILVQLPGEGEPARVREVIAKGCQLALQLVEGKQVYTSEAEALSSQGGVLPAGTQLVPGRIDSRQTSATQPQGEGWYLLSRSVIVTGQ